ALAAASPSYWWFVAIFACGRPLLSATNGLAQVTAAEQTASADRAKAVALIAAGYGAGAGVIAIVHSLASHAIGFRGVFVMALIPLALLPLLWRWIEEPDRFTVAAAGSEHPFPVLDAVARPFRRRLVVIVVLAFAVSLITGPANSFVFLFAQNFLHQRGTVTAAMVVGAGVAGLAGLLAGRWLADRVGRRLTGALAMVTVALFATLTYTGSAPALLAGYILGVFAASVFAPAAGALINELFPTSVRASWPGWSSSCLQHWPWRRSGCSPRPVGVSRRISGPIRERTSQHVRHLVQEVAASAAFWVRDLSHHGLRPGVGENEGDRDVLAAAHRPGARDQHVQAIRHQPDDRVGGNADRGNGVHGGAPPHGIAEHDPAAD